MNKRKWAVGVGAALSLSVLAVGCGAANNTAGGGASGNTSGAGSNGKSFAVGLVTDTGGLNDHSFNHLAYVGLQKAEQQLGVHGDVVQSTSAADYIPNLTRFAQKGDKLVIAVGYLMAPAVEKVAQEYPKTKFLIIDDAITDRPNVTSAIFDTQQCGYLVGALAGLMEKDHASIKGMNSQNVLGVVGGQNIPPVTTYIAGFYQGAQKVDPGVKILLKYANSFTDEATGQSLAQDEISQGADIVFPVAGGTGTGSINAAKTAGVYAIGVDANQNYLAPQTVITSALKAVDVATYDVIQETLNGTFKKGVQTFNLANDGVGMAPPTSVVPKSIVTQVDQLAGQIKSGAITVSPNIPKS